MYKKIFLMIFAGIFLFSLASFGSAEQQSVYREAIERMRERNEVFYSSLLRNFLAHRASEDLSECAE